MYFLRFLSIFCLSLYRYSLPAPGWPQPVIDAPLRLAQPIAFNTLFFTHLFLPPDGRAAAPEGAPEAWLWSFVVGRLSRSGQRWHNEQDASVCAHTCQRTHAMGAGTGLIGHPGHAGRDEIEQELLDSLEGSPT